MNLSQQLVNMSVCLCVETVQLQTYVRIGVFVSPAVHLKDTCVQGLLVVQRKGYCIQTASPILPTRFLV